MSFSLISQFCFMPISLADASSVTPPKVSLEALRLSEPILLYLPSADDSYSCGVPCLFDTTVLSLFLVEALSRV